MRHCNTILLPPQGAALRGRLRIPPLAVPLLAALALCGCARTIASENLASFGKAASDIAQQSDLAFDESNRLARQVAIDQFVRSGAPGLSEEHFVGAVPREQMLAWHERLSALADYGTVLSSLVDTSRSVQTSDAISALSTKLRAAPIGASISPGIAAGFSALGGALVDARAQQQARSILSRTDPSVQQLLSAMSDAIGPDDGKGLRGTVFTLSNESLKSVRGAYSRAATDRNEAQQRKLIDAYLKGLDTRDAQLRSLANLRSSLVNLAAAHSAASKGAPVTVGALISQIERRLDETKRLYAAISKDSSGGRDAGK